MSQSRSSYCGAQLALAAALLIAASGVNAQVDYRVLSVPWSNNTPTYLGSGIDVDLINQSRSICLDNDAAKVQWLDGTGAVKTDAAVHIVTDYKSLAKTLNLEVDYKAKGDVDFKAIKGGASVALNVKYESMAKDESRTLAIVIKAYSDYGRKGLTTYDVLPEFKALLTAKQYDDFRMRCGTHSVVAQHNEAMVAVVIMVTDLTSTAKSSLEGLYKSSVNASGTIEAAQVSGTSEKSLSWKNLIETAYQLGTVDVTFASIGGAGLSDALKLVVAPNPRDIAGIVQTLAGLGTSFTQPNSAPSSYILISNAALGYAGKVVDSSKLDTLNSYYLQLSRVDYALSRVDGYKSTFPALHSDMYAQAEPVLKLRGYRKQLVDAIEVCAVKDECNYKPPAELGMFYLEDILLPDSLKLNCSYARFDSKDGKVKLNVLKNAAVELRGRVRLSEYVGLPSAVLARYGPTSVPPRKMATSWPALSVDSTIQPDGTRRLKALIDNQTFDAIVEPTNTDVVIKNEAQLEQLRNDILGSIYAVNIQAMNGIFIRNTVGPPFAQNCPLKQPVVN